MSISKVLGRAAFLYGSAQAYSYRGEVDKAIETTSLSMMYLARAGINEIGERFHVSPEMAASTVESFKDALLAFHAEIEEKM
ncbi:MAG: hypothetical protein AAF633_05615 [Chloroflexota bacterium]